MRHINNRTFDLTLEDAEFVYFHLPPTDDFSKELWKWIEEEYIRQGKPIEGSFKV